MGGSSPVKDDITGDAQALILVVVLLALDILCNTGLQAVRYSIC